MILRRLAFFAFPALVWASSGGCSSADEPVFSAESVDLARSAAALVNRQELETDVRAIVDGRQKEGGELSRFRGFTDWVHVQSASYVANAFTAAGHVPTRETTDDGGLSLTNVYAEVKGTLRPDEIVLVTGHHDSWWLAGADDNASAIGVLIQGSRALKTLAPPKRTIRLVAYDREEEGLFGSERYVRAHGAEKVRIVLNMDCVAFASNADGSQDAPTGLALRDRGDFLAIIANQSAKDDAARAIDLATRLPAPVDVLALVAPGDSAYPGIGDFLRSDHASFWKAGVKAFFITDTANFRNPNYHQKTDLPDTLDYEFYHRVAQFVVGAAFAFANED